jgi:hypothetical protein
MKKKKKKTLRCFTPTGRMVQVAGIRLSDGTLSPFLPALPACICAVHPRSSDAFARLVLGMPVSPIHHPLAESSLEGSQGNK